MRASAIPLSTPTADLFLESNINRPSWDYRFVYYPDWRSCPLECRYDGRCNAFTFGWDTSANQWQCWLQNTVSVIHPAGTRAASLESTPSTSWVSSARSSSRDVQRVDVREMVDLPA